ncbi:aminotransferase class IV [Brucella sp. C7-11G]
MLKKRTVYLNGNFVPQDEANISVFDRGFLFADAVYEVVSVIDGKILDFDGHAARLDRSLSELRIRQPLHRQTLLDILRQLIIENQLDQGLVYLQISRGNPGDRDFAFPEEPVQPTVVMFTQAVANLIDGPKSKIGVKVISVPDLRWARRENGPKLRSRKFTNQKTEVKLGCGVRNRMLQTPRPKSVRVKVETT